MTDLPSDDELRTGVSDYSEEEESERGTGSESEAEERLQIQAVEARVISARKNKRGKSKGGSSGHQKALKDAREHARNPVMTRLLQPLDNNRADFDKLMKMYFRDEMKMNPAQVKVRLVVVYHILCL